jgi:hypothetical protein
MKCALEREVEHYFVYTDRHSPSHILFWNHETTVGRQVKKNNLRNLKVTPKEQLKLKCSWCSHVYMPNRYATYFTLGITQLPKSLQREWLTGQFICNKFYINNTKKLTTHFYGITVFYNLLLLWITANRRESWFSGEIWGFHSSTYECVSWDTVLCSLAETDQRFISAYCFHHQSGDLNGLPFCKLNMATLVMGFPDSC